MPIGPSQIPITAVPASRLAPSDLVKSYGLSGTATVHGFIEEEYNSSLQGAVGLEKYDKMRKSDAQVQATLLVMELPIRSTRWYIEPAHDENGEVTPEAQEHADFLERALFEKMRTTWDDHLRNCLQMLPFGFYVAEKVFTADEEHVWLESLEGRKQTTIYRWQTEGGQPGITQMLPQAPLDGPNKGKFQVSIPEAKLLVFTFRREGDNIKGVSVLRSAYKHWYIKDTLYKFDSVKHEKQSVGIPVLTLPEQASASDEAKAVAILQNFRANEQLGIVLPSDKWKFEFADLKVHTQSDLWKSIDHHNRQISKNVLAQFMDLASGDGGSYALSEDQSDFFLLALEAIARQIEDVHNRFLVPQLIDLNYDDVERYPKLKHDKLGNVDYKTIADVLSSMVDKGVLSKDDELESWVRTQMGLPQRVIEDDEGEDDEPTDPKIEPPEDDPKDDKPDGDEVPEEKKGDENVEANEAYEMYSAFIDNDLIMRLQNQVDPEDLGAMKERGFHFNDYEDEAWRPLTFAERKVNLSSLKKALEDASANLGNTVDNVTRRQKEDILKQVKKAVENDDIKAVGQIKARYTGDLSKALTDVQKEMFELGKKSAAAELSAKVPPTNKEVRGVMRVGNDKIVEEFTSDLETTAAKTVTELAAKKGGSVKAIGSAEAVGAVDEALEKLIAKKSSMKTLMVTGALNLGRATIYERYPEKVYAMQYSAILDDRTTDHCLSLDGRVVRPGSIEFFRFSPPQHYECRSIWVAILIDEEFKPAIDGIPASIKPTIGIDNYSKQAPVIKKGSSAVKVLEQEKADRQAKIDQYQTDGKFPNRIEQHQKRIDEINSALDFSDEWVPNGVDVADVPMIFFENVKAILSADGVRFA